MNKPHYQLILFVLLSLTGAACLKHKYHLLEVDAGLLDRYYYQPGTYWIMKDSATGRIDSFFITTTSKVNQSVRSGLDVQNAISQMAQISADNTDTFFWEWRYVQSTLTLKVQSKLPPGSSYYCGAAAYPLVVTYKLFPLNSRYYANVNESNMHGDSTAAAGAYNNWLYLNETDGMVKLRISQPSDPEKSFVWELVRRQIVL